MKRATSISVACAMICRRMVLNVAATSAAAKTPPIRPVRRGSPSPAARRSLRLVRHHRRRDRPGALQDAAGDHPPDGVGIGREGRAGGEDQQPDDDHRGPARARQGRDQNTGYHDQPADDDQAEAHASPREIAGDVVGGAITAHAGHGE